MTRAKHFEEFKDHTLVKHYLLGAYLKRWGTILLPKFRRVWFVDAFAGAGCDLEGNPGSPVIAARIAQDVNATQFPGGITSKTGMHVLAIEREPDFYRSLETQLQPWTSMRPQYVHVRSGVLEEYIDKIMAHAGTDPILFFLDPFGLDGLAADTYTKALKQAHNELLVLFNDEGAVRLHGKATADPETALDPIRYVVEHPMLFEEFEAERMATAQEKSKRSAAGHKSNWRAKAIMDRAFGGEHWLDLVRGAPDWQLALRRGFQELLVDSGAPLILPFSIDSVDGRHKYFLIHASQQKRAYAAMKDAMYRTHNEQKKGATLPAAKPRIEATDLRVVIEILQRRFGGELVRWSDRNALSVQDVALEDTPIWRHELPALHAALLKLGWGEMVGPTARAQAFRFPKVA